MEESKKIKKGIELRENNNQLTLDDLEKSGLYDSYLLDCLRKEEFDKLLLLLTPEERKDVKYMEPLLFAVKNDIGTYKVYQYYGENLQSDYEITLEVISSEPELILNTPFSKSEQFILKNIRTYPRLIHYMNNTLKENEEIVCNLCRINFEVMDEIVKESEINIGRVILHDRKRNQNIEKNDLKETDLLENNKDFIKICIEEKGPEILQYASEEIKNDYQFLKDMASEDENIIDYVVENASEFGLDGISGVRDTSKESTFLDCKELLEEVINSGTDDPRYAKVLAKIEEVGYDNPCVLRWITAMVNQRDDVSPETLNKILNYALLTMEKTKMEIGDDVDFSVMVSRHHEFIEPHILNSLKEKIESQGLEVDESVQEKIDRYTDFYTMYSEKLKEQKNKNRDAYIAEFSRKKEEGKQQPTQNILKEPESNLEDNNESAYKIDIGDIENATKQVTLAQLQEETEVTIKKVREDNQKQEPKELIEDNEWR